jgi:phosphate transport system protein
MIQSRHILQDFDAALEALRGDVLMMASLTDRNLQNAMSCLLDRDADLCAVTLADEEEIDALEKKIDEDGVNLLLRFQPVASDLRQVVSAMKVSGNLERVADQAVKIAERSRSLALEAPLDALESIRPIFIDAITLFRDSVRAYADMDMELARSIRPRDRAIDQMNRDITNDLTVRMTSQPERISHYLHLVFIARYLERVGDHAKNIGEDAVYAAEAEDIRHPTNAFSAAGR